MRKRSSTLRSPQLPLGLLLCLVLVPVLVSSAFADVPLVEHDLLAKKAAKEALKAQGGEVQGGGTGAVSLIDSSGLEWFLNTDITFSTSESASGAASEASYTQAVAASTSGGGTSMTTLSDAFDGYNGLCITTAAAGCPGSDTGGPAMPGVYNENGPLAGTECGGRQLVFPVQNILGLDVQRRVYVPAADEFARWYDTFTNTTGAPITFFANKANNLGSDGDTTIDTSSDGDAVVEVTDLWSTSFEAFDGGGSSFDPRLGHVYQGEGAPTTLAAIDFTDGENTPSWSYQLTVDPGATVAVVQYATGQPNLPDARSQSATLAAGEELSMGACPLDSTQLEQVANFLGEPVNPLEVPTLD